MKQKILYILMMITALLGGNGEVWAADDWGHLPITYSEFRLGSKDVWSQSGNWDDRRKEIYFSGIPHILSFSYERSVSIATYCDWFVEVSVDGNNWDRIKEIEGSNSGSVSIELDPSVRYVCLIYSGNYGGYFRNISITERRYLTANKSAIDFGSLNTNATSALQTVTISHCNAGAGVTITSNNPKFKASKSSLSTTGADKMGTEDFTITFDNSEVGTYEDIITVTDPSGKNSSITIPVRGVATKEKTYPDFTWTLSNLATGREYTDFFSSTNTDTPVSYASSDASIANVVDGKLVTSSKEGTATITVTQQGNDDWHEKSQSFTVNVSKPQNHLPLAINESNWSILARNISGGSFKWDGGIKLGDGGGGFNWEDKIAQIEFLGIPDRISFDYDAGADGASDIEWRVESSSNGNDFEAIWSSSSASGNADIEIKDKSSKYVRLIWSGNFGGFFKKVKISELRYLTSTASSLDFGENVEGDAVSKTFTLKHANAGYGVTLTSSNPDVFEVSPAQLTTTGGDKMGEETITVTYKNNTVGEHSGTITIADPNGTNASVLVDLSATTISNGLILNPTQQPNYDVRTYKRVVLQRTLPMGYSTITLPFTYNIGGVEGGYVAQLALVTHNQQDGYTLYFNKVSDGIMQPNQPYVLYLPMEIKNPEWGETTVVAPEELTVEKNDWTMRANYEPNTLMHGNYGIVGGLLCRGEGEKAIINAYTAYFIPPTTQNIRTRVAILDEWGNATFIGEVKDGVLQTEEGIYGLDGVRQNELHKGINIVKTKDGTVRKVLK